MLKYQVLDFPNFIVVDLSKKMAQMSMPKI